MTDNKFKAIIFDAESTLFGERVERAQVFLDKANEFGAELSCIDHVTAELNRAEAAMPKTIDNNISLSTTWTKELNRQVYSSLGLSAGDALKAAKDTVAYYSKAKSYFVYPDVAESLKALSVAKIPMGVLANWDENLPDLIKRLRLDKFFDFVVPSAELRTPKPERAIFDRVLFRCGIAAGDALHIGADFDRDINGALNAGMSVLLMDRQNNIESPIYEGVKVVSSLYDVLDCCELTAHGI
ncbi:MAG: HAD hydrolase-like protein [Planctomycetota bacterium]|nr:HAD hydrolase-like protein [Planctomycetota bacterium]